MAEEVKKSLSSADIIEIMKLLPHRYPFLLVDKIIDIDGDDSAIGIKNVTANEPHFTGHFPDNPIMPGVLIIEGMAQTAGILVGAARNFQEKVILAKIGKASFSRLVRPGEQVVYAAKIVNVSEQGASIEGIITSRTTVNGQAQELPTGTVDMMFSHIDNNMSGMKFPEFNFVFNSQFMDLFETYRRELDVKLP